MKYNISYIYITYIRQCSHLVPGTVPGYDSKLSTNVNTPFSKYPTPKFGLGARARVQGRDLVLGH